MKPGLEGSLPYGIWRCAGGREVLFNRAYQPLWARIEGQVSHADPGERVLCIEEEQFFFEDADSPVWANPMCPRAIRKAARARALEVLASWGMSSV